MHISFAFVSSFCEAQMITLFPNILPFVLPVDELLLQLYRMFIV
jgi:hypothetical protein